MKKSTVELLVFFLGFSVAYSGTALASAGTKTKWISLFDGKTLDG